MSAVEVDDVLEWLQGEAAERVPTIELRLARQRRGNALIQLIREVHVQGHRALRRAGQVLSPVQDARVARVAGPRIVGRVVQIAEGEISDVVQAVQARERAPGTR